MRATRAHDLVIAWAGLLIGAIAWYAAHELSFYLVRDNCRSPWIAPAIHLAALAAAVGGGIVSAGARRAARDEMQLMSAWIGAGAAALFSLALLFQGVASLVYSGCER
jgi:hypothetical protein